MTIPSDGAVSVTEKIIAAILQGNDKHVPPEYSQSTLRASAKLRETLPLFIELEAVTPAIQERDEAIRELHEILTELHQLMEDTYAGTYTPDSFTTQPAERILAKYAHFINDIPKEKAG